MLETVLREIHRIRQTQDRLLVAIDGRCASGKTTLAHLLQEELACEVIHMDDFFLRPEQRTAKRYEEPGGNVDRERLIKEVLEPLRKGQPFTYRPFDCHSMMLQEPISCKPSNITIIEGTYSCHPALWDYYDVHIFLTTTSEKQWERLGKREGANLDMFAKKWIPLEERYFDACKPDQNSELVWET